MAYTKKIVNGVLINCNPADQTALAAKDAAGWSDVQGPPPLATSEKFERMISAFGLTIAEFKAELAKP